MTGGGRSLYIQTALNTSYKAQHPPTLGLTHDDGHQHTTHTAQRKREITCGAYSAYLIWTCTREALFYLSRFLREQSSIKKNKSQIPFRRFAVKCVGCGYRCNTTP